MKRYPWWLLALALIGAGSMIVVGLSLFSSLGRRPRAFHVTELPAVDDPDFLVSVAGAAGAPVGVGGTAELLDNGVAFYPAIVEALAGARRSVNFAAYIWEPGRASDQLFAALIGCASRGVQVRLLLDGVGGLKAPEEDMARLRAAGGQIEPFRPARFGKLTRFHKRNHRRAIVVDGEIAFTGGMAVGDKWLGDAESPEHWRDSMVRLTGPPAAAVQSAFVALWAPIAGEILSGPDFFPPQPSSEAQQQPPLRHVGLSSSPSSEDHPLRLLYLQTFLSSRKTLYLATPYFVPDVTLRDAVASRARAGVDVRILLPNEHTDAKPIRHTSHRYYEELLAAGVRIWEYQPTMMHAKTVVVDRKWSVVGSANMDIRSNELNHENVVGILDGTFAAKLEDSYLRDLARSREIVLDEFRRRGLRKRLLERAASIFEEQY